jgi:predicted metal-dependent RNase
LPAIPIYLVGLGLKINKIYDRLLHKTYPKYQPKLLKTITSDVLFSKNYRKPCIILATSGMMMPNTLSYEIAGEFLEDAKNGIALVGWADPETPGGKFRDKNYQEIRKTFGIEKINCSIDIFHFSAHSHREELLHMAEQMYPSTCLLCHGDADSLDWMKGAMEERRIAEKVIIPVSHEFLKL